MKIVNHFQIRLFLRFVFGIIALSFVLDSSVPATFAQKKGGGPGTGEKPGLIEQGLTGTWTGEDNSTYYVRQVGEIVWWVGQSQDKGVSYTNVFRGVKSGNEVTGFWADVPAGRNKGALRPRECLRASAFL